MTPKNPSTLPARLKVCYITDGKPGHQNQLRGLEAQLKKRINARSCWLDTRQTPRKWRHTNTLVDEVRESHWVIGAGHRTHRHVLWLGRGKFTCILMKPSLPIRWFSACIIPAHDSPPLRASVLRTTGVLNPVTPLREQPPGAWEKQPGLILLGGPSKHYGFPEKSLIDQIIAVLEASDRPWILSDSRRTPEGMMATLEEIVSVKCLNDRLTFVSHTKTPPAWLLEQYARAGEIWVTPDSVSMVYEALTSGKPTGLFQLPPKRRNRIVQGIDQLISEEKVTPFSQWQASHEVRRITEPFCEAARAAEWLVSRYLDWQARHQAS